MKNGRLKILLGCYACDPGFGSEPGMGWNFVSNIAKHHDVHAIVEEGEFKANLTQYASQHPEEVKNITFHFIPRTHHETLRKIWPPSYYWFYRNWNKRAYKLAVKLDKEEQFDIVHQITLAGFREPGYLWKLGKPFIWGPIGGFSQTAWCLLKGTGLHSIVYFGMRNILNTIQKRFGYAGRKVAPYAHTILVSDSQGMKDVSKLWKKTPVHMLEVGTQAETLPDITPSRTPESPLRICWAGQLIPLKALELLLHAIHLCREKNIHLDVMGKGENLKKWQNLTIQLGLGNRVTFHGYVEHGQALEMMKKCHIFCHTSIKEGGTGTVILEALQCGLPIVALDHCGHAAVVDDSCGIKIPIQSRKQIVRDLAEQIDQLADNEELRHTLAMGASARGRFFSWEEKMKQLNQIYDSAVSS